ncbi:hypothetical protein BO94DRAFT_477044 [Aspergillus sclerotioniger CBS 115572]|uniref:Integral membrane protein n=1 Tax=Aspergillus sclerotioniger CBS 115572 TaxID=1450535 RepID=A0A317V920_9EURO|nr:hypothetical protein BO94DRAFT_477044 [Aspergillus sclerotioniger CBS 115572]PWY70864.1 hypothetical protein BO94DRAFT_477044 [Aspergillus sclerotioniger CBS 115572]
MERRRLHYYPGYGSAASTCSANNAFSSKESRIVLAFSALYFLVYCCLSAIAATRFFSSKRRASTFRRWFLFGVSIYSMIISQIIYIVIITLWECEVIDSPTYNLTTISIDWFDYLGYYALYAVILLPICRRLHQQAQNDRLIVVTHSVCLALLGILFIAALALETDIANGIYNSQNYTFYNLVKPERDLRTACYAFEVVAMLMAAASMIKAMMRAPHLRKGTLGSSLAVLIISCLGLPLTRLAGYVESSYWVVKTQSEVAYANRSLEARIFIMYFFYSCAFLSALLVAGFRRLANDSYKWTRTAAMGPVYAPEEHPIRQA